MNLKCRLDLHNWSKWYDAGEGKISIFGFLTNNEQSSEPVLFQEKICETCKIKKRQYVRYEKS